MRGTLSRIRPVSAGRGDRELSYSPTRVFVEGYAMSSFLAAWLAAGRNAGLWNEADIFTLDDFLRYSGRRRVADLFDADADDSEAALSAGVMALFAALDEGSLCLPLSADELRLRWPAPPETLGKAEAERWLGKNLRWASAFPALLSAGAYADMIGNADAPEPWPPLLWRKNRRQAGDGIPPFGYLFFEKYFRNATALRDALQRRAGPAGSAAGACPGEWAAAAGSLRRAVSEVRARSDFPWSPDQGRALALTLTRRFSVAAGGPGSGKTTLIFSWLRLLARLGYAPGEIVLAAPTGRAAQRLGESIAAALARLPSVDAPAPEDAALAGLSGQTLHRLLGYNPESGRYRLHAGNPLPCRAAAVDEVSMIDAGLFARLLGALPADARLLLIGDPDQLPSVEAGSILADLLPPGPGRAAPLPPDAAELFRDAFAGDSEPMPPETGRHGAGLSGRIARLGGTHRAQGPLAEWIGRLADLPEAAIDHPGLLSHPAAPGGFLFPRVPDGVLTAARDGEGLRVGVDWSRLPPEGALWLDWPAAPAPAGTVFTEGEWEGEGEGISTARVSLSGCRLDRPDAFRLALWRGLAECWWRRDAARPDGYAARLREAERFVGRSDEDPERERALSNLFARLQDRQVLTLLRRGPWGCDDLNARLAEALRGDWDPASGPPRGGTERLPLFSGAPVLATRNDYERGLFNGAVGVAVRSAADGRLWAIFPGGVGPRTGRLWTAFRPDEAPGLEWGFALTVHKSQGSEYGETLLAAPPAVFGAGERMLTRELAYTGVTRARRRALAAGDREAWLAALSRRARRHSGMDWWGGGA